MKPRRVSQPQARLLGRLSFPPVRWPNQAPEPTPRTITFPGRSEVFNVVAGVAHLGRSASRSDRLAMLFGSRSGGAAREDMRPLRPWFRAVLKNRLGPSTLLRRWLLDGRGGCRPIPGPREPNQSLQPTLAVRPFSRACSTLGAQWFSWRARLISVVRQSNLRIL